MREELGLPKSPKGNLNRTASRPEKEEHQLEFQSRQNKPNAYQILDSKQSEGVEGIDNIDILTSQYRATSGENENEK